MITLDCFTQLFQLLYRNFERGFMLACYETSRKSFSFDETLFQTLSVVPICTALGGVGDMFVK